MVWRTTPIALAILTAACSGDADSGGLDSNSVEGSQVLDQDPEQGSQPVSLSAGDLAFVCRGAVAAIFSQPIDTIEEYHHESEISYVFYTRANDQTEWRNRCRINGNRVIWAGVDIDGPGTGNGRWRNHPMDEVIEFDLSETQLIIRQLFSDGSSIVDQFGRN